MYKIFRLTLVLVLAFMANNSYAHLTESSQDGEREYQYHIQRAMSDKEHFWYVNLGGGTLSSGSSSDVAPLFAFGRRFDIGNAALDISAGWAGSEHSGYDVEYFYFPKVVYLAYEKPNAISSFFYGGGLSWSGYRKMNQHFSGISAEAVVGYELQRNSNIRPMVQLELSQPLLAYSYRGTHPGPAVQMSMNVGF